MKSIETSKLSGVALDWAVAVCEGLAVRKDPMGFSIGSEAGYWIWDEINPKRKRYQLIGRDYSPSTNWATAGLIIESHEIFPSRVEQESQNSEKRYQAGIGNHRVQGGTPLIAVMRSLVATQLGNVIEMPENLIAALDLA